MTDLEPEQQGRPRPVTAKRAAWAQRLRSSDPGCTEPGMLDAYDLSRCRLHRSFEASGQEMGDDLAGH